MTDQSIDAEIEANNRRKEAHDDDNDGSVVDALEDALNPIADAIERAGEDDDSESAEERREGNDADQRSS